MQPVTLTVAPLMSRTYTYENSFDDGGDNLDGATLLRDDGDVGVQNATISGDPDNEFVLFNGTGSATRLDLNADLTGSEQVSAFSTSMTLDFATANGPWGNGQPDGMSFNFGNPDSFAGANSEELGLTQGLTIRINPFDWTPDSGSQLAIVWNGVVIGTVAIPDISVLPALTFAVDVDAYGNVSASLGTYTATATIPSNEWFTTDQSGWDFVLAGRTGGNGGQAYIDDVTWSAPPEVVQQLG